MTPTLSSSRRRTTNYFVRKRHSQATLNPSDKSGRGFTLVELVVVMAIILKLSYLLLWALSTVCAAVESMGNPAEQKQPAPTTPPPA